MSQQGVTQEPVAFFYPKPSQPLPALQLLVDQTRTPNNQICRVFWSEEAHPEHIELSLNQLPPHYAPIRRDSQRPPHSPYVVPFSPVTTSVKKRKPRAKPSVTHAEWSECVPALSDLVPVDLDGHSKRKNDCRSDVCVRDDRDSHVVSTSAELLDAVRAEKPVYLAIQTSRGTAECCRVQIKLSPDNRATIIVPVISDRRFNNAPVYSDGVRYLYIVFDGKRAPFPMSCKRKSPKKPKRPKQANPSQNRPPRTPRTPKQVVEPVPLQATLEAAHPPMAPNPSHLPTLHPDPISILPEPHADSPVIVQPTPFDLTIVSFDSTIVTTSLPPIDDDPFFSFLISPLPLPFDESIL